LPDVNELPKNAVCWCCCWLKQACVGCSAPRVATLKDVDYCRSALLNPIWGRGKWRRYLSASSGCAGQYGEGRSGTSPAEGGAAIFRRFSDQIPLQLRDKGGITFFLTLLVETFPLLMLLLQPFNLLYFGLEKRKKKQT
jgi:hypothetical protein